MSKQTFEELVLKSLKELQDGQAALQGIYTELRTEMHGSVDQLRTEMHGSIKKIQEELHRQGVLQEEMVDKIDQIIEVISPEMVKNNEQDARLDGHDQDLRLHNGRLNILESA